MKKNVKSENLSNLRFNLTEDMNNAFIEILLIKEMLEKAENKGKKRKLLEQQYAELKFFFVNEFRKNNVKKRELYNKFMS